MEKKKKEEEKMDGKRSERKDEGRIKRKGNEEKKEMFVSDYIRSYDSNRV